MLMFGFFCQYCRMREEDLPAEKIMKIDGSGSKPMEDRGGVEENIIDLIEG